MTISYSMYELYWKHMQLIWLMLYQEIRSKVSQVHIGEKKDKFIIQWKKLQISTHSTKRYFAFHTQMIFLKTEIDLHININTLWDICRRQESTGVKPGTRVTCAEKQISGLILENSPFFSYSLRPFFRTVSHTKWFNSSYFEFSQVYTECYSKGPIMQFTIQ